MHLFFFALTMAEQTKKWYEKLWYNLVSWLEHIVYALAPIIIANIGSVEAYLTGQWLDPAVVSISVTIILVTAKKIRNKSEWVGA